MVVMEGVQVILGELSGDTGGGYDHTRIPH